ncbi:hypothetical protein EDF68_1285 [Ochrobactrum sp. BH3]|nr:hypothetical protein EDF68_1285 [Ochrobactrum sp. BH3]
MTLIVTNEQMIKEIPEVVQEIVVPRLVAIYDDRNAQIGTAFLTMWKGRQLLVTAKHCLYGPTFSEDPWIKKIYVEDQLVELNTVATSTIACTQNLDVAIVHVSGFRNDRALPYSVLQFNKTPPDRLTLVGFLARDFKRDISAETLRPAPFCYTNTKYAWSSEFVGISYPNRAITTDTGQREFSPIPRGLSGTLMLDAVSMLLGQIKVYGVFTDERMHEAHVFGTHIDALDSLFDKLADLE